MRSKMEKRKIKKNEEKKIGDNLKKLVEYWSIKESTYKVEGKTIQLKKINVNQKSKSLYEIFANGKNFKLSVLEIDNYNLAMFWLGSRVLYYFTYMFGILYLRTLVWGVSIVCLVMMAISLI